MEGGEEKRKKRDERRGIKGKEKKYRIKGNSSNSRAF